jgi:cyclase
MRRARVIPTLLINDRKLVKTTQFKNASYVGDPINALRIFNEKEVDEICILDIGATRDNKPPDMTYIGQLASECFMPMSYGGGITRKEQANELFKLGVEKVVIGSAAFTNSKLIADISSMGGAQSVVACIDMGKDFLGRWKVFVKNGTTNTKMNPVDFARKMEELGAGEILLQDITHEGTLRGFDLLKIKEIASGLNIPVVASGGAATPHDFRLAIQAGASAVAAGAMFVFKGPHKAVLINYPDQETLTRELYSHLD